MQLNAQKIELVWFGSAAELAAYPSAENY